VTLNHFTPRDPETPVWIERDQIAVDGCSVKAAENIYLMMNKPRGLVTTASDEKGRDTVYSLLSEWEEPLPWIAPVGRLDKASEGLLLLTNDSEWAARVSAPESHLPKTYHVQIDTIATEELMREVLRGVKSEGDFLRAVECRLLRTGEKNSWLEITLEEGKNRHIRRMLSVLGLEVLRLVRVSIGPLQLGRLAKGAYRHLRTQEKNALDLSMNKSCRKLESTTISNP
jgi:23S rRNA pseudouridine2605 synthase